MFNFIFHLIRIFFSLFFSDNRNIIIQNVVLWKENEILKRKLKKRIRFKFFDKLFYALFIKLSNTIKNHITLIKPETVLKWQRKLIKKFWTFASEKPGNGRPPVQKDIKLLILEMKNKNLFWGCKWIRGELLKLGVDLHKKTIGNILRDFRRSGTLDRFGKKRNSRSFYYI